MAIDKSLRQHYQSGNEVSPFRKGLETIAGKGANVIGKATDMASKFAPEKTGTFDLQSMVKSQAKSAIKNKIQSAVLSKLGLSFLNPYMGLASLFGFDFTKGFAPGMKEPGQTQAQYEAARAARQTQSRIDNLLSRKAAGKSYSQENLNELTMGSRPGFYGNVPTVSRVNIAKNLIGMPENLGDRGSISPPPTGLVNPIQQAIDEAKAEKAKEDAFKESFAFEDLKGGPKETKGPTGPTDDGGFGDETGQRGGGPGPGPGPGPSDGGFGGESGRRGGNGGRNGGGNGGDKGGRDGPSGRKAYGGLIGKPLPGRNRYL